MVPGALEGVPGSHFDTQGRPDAKKTENSSSLAALGPPFWSPFGTLFGTWSSHIAILAVFVEGIFQCLLFHRF